MSSPERRPAFDLAACEHPTSSPPVTAVSAYPSHEQNDFAAASTLPRSHPPPLNPTLPPQHGRDTLVRPRPAISTRLPPPRSRCLDAVATTTSTHYDPTTITALLDLAAPAPSRHGRHRHRHIDATHPIPRRRAPPAWQHRHDAVATQARGCHRHVDAASRPNSPVLAVSVSILWPDCRRGPVAEDAVPTRLAPTQLPPTIVSTPPCWHGSTGTTQPPRKPVAAGGSSGGEWDKDMGYITSAKSPILHVR
ncbi:hypothetical protein EDB85DRAFT_2291913 [Lactarius pseudohatsudake]|nr:hypothetical protein EDB85DRAFT_2291913 [Lactarius pseudohatsudake]